MDSIVGWQSLFWISHTLIGQHWPTSLIYWWMGGKCARILQAELAISLIPQPFPETWSGNTFNVVHHVVIHGKVRSVSKNHMVAKTHIYHSLFPRSRKLAILSHLLIPLHKLNNHPITKLCLVTGITAGIMVRRPRCQRSQRCKTSRGHSLHRHCTVDAKLTLARRLV
jgi:hypothetical protein